MEEWSLEVEWSQIFRSLVGLNKTNTELFLNDIITTLTSIQARISFFKDIPCLCYFKVKISLELYVHI